MASYGWIWSSVISSKSLHAVPPQFPLTSSSSPHPQLHMSQTTFTSGHLISCTNIRLYAISSTYFPHNSDYFMQLHIQLIALGTHTLWPNFTSKHMPFQVYFNVTPFQYHTEYCEFIQVHLAYVTSPFLVSFVGIIVIWQYHIYLSIYFAFNSNNNE